jgi:hypothetical protein
MAVRQVIGRGALALPRGLGGLRRRRNHRATLRGFTVDDVGALAEFLKHCAGYARDVGTAAWPEGTK